MNGDAYLCRRSVSRTITSKITVPNVTLLVKSVGMAACSLRRYSYSFDVSQDFVSCSGFCLVSTGVTAVSVGV